MSIRPARPDDVPVLLELVRGLAEYEREPDAVRATEADLLRDLFGPDPRVFAHVAEEAPGRIAGFAIWFLTYSTWEGAHGIHLEDLYVRPGARGGGHGTALLAELARIAVERGHRRVEWAVLDWNAPAIAFYDALGSSSMDGWTTRRLDGGALRALAARAAAVPGAGAR